MDDLTARDDASGMHGPSPILGPDGRPLRRAPSPSDRRKAAEEIAAPELVGVRTLWDQSVASGLKPERLAALLRGAIRGDHRYYLELAEEMEERDAHYASVLRTRKLALSQIRPSVIEGPKDDAKIVAAVQELLEDPLLPDVTEDLMDGLGKGYSAVEILWGQGPEPWLKPYYVWRDPKYFTFDFISRSQVRLQALGTIDGLELPPGRFIVHAPKTKSGIPIRGGFARAVAWAFLFKSYSLKDWASFLDIYGMPIRLGKYNPAATAEDRGKLLQAVTQIAADAAAIIPESMIIELLETKTAGSGNSTPFEGLCRFLDEQMSKMILGQTMTVENGGSLAQAQVHNQIRIDILQADARQLAATLNRDLIAPFVAFNFGDGAPVPRVVIPVAEPQDVAAISNALGVLVPLGLRVKADEVREKIGLSKPEDGDEILEPAKAPEPASKPGGDRELADAAMNSHQLRKGCPCCGETRLSLNAQGVEPDVVDAIGAEEAADWEEQLGPLIDAIRDALAASSSYVEFQVRLNELLSDLPTEELEQRLAISALKARGLGLAGAKRDG
jgi:phage gp29-like protein